jgi:hypothetical protein
MLGKTPFGVFHRSRMLILFGLCTAVIGTVACLIPTHLVDLVTALIVIILLAEGITGYLKMVFAKDNARCWIRIPGITRHLAIACGFVYLMEIIIGLVTLFPGITTIPQTAVLCIIFGISLFYIAWCVNEITQKYPLKETEELRSPGNGNEGKGCCFFSRDASLSTPVTLMLIMGIILIIIAILMIPMSMGMILYSHDAQYGLLLVIMALQVLALGETPVGIRTRSWILFLAGLVFAGFGMVSCIVPGLLIGEMAILLGIWNLVAGITGLINLILPILQSIRNPPAEPVPVPKILIKLLVIGIILQLATILFGINMLLPGLIPGLIALGLLFFMGILLIEVAYIQTILPVPESDELVSR